MSGYANRIIAMSDKLMRKKKKKKKKKKNKQVQKKREKKYMKNLQHSVV